MVSKTVICVFLLAVLAASYAKPHHGKSSEHRGDRQRQEQQYLRECKNVDQQQDSDSNESDRAPCRLRDQDNERQGRNQGQNKLRIQDTSSESQEHQRIKVITSQEESNVEKIIKQGPQHTPINSSQNGNKYMHGAQAMHNQQRPRGQISDESNEENNSRAEQNQIHRQ